MDQENRGLIAFALSFALLGLWRIVYPPHPIKPPANAATQSQARTSSSIPGVTTPATEPPVLAAAAGKSAASAAAQAAVSFPVQQGAQAEEIVVENDVYKVTLSTQGAVVKSWVLKKYRDEKENFLD